MSSNLHSYRSPVGELVVEAEGGVISALSIGGAVSKSADEVTDAPFIGLFKVFDRYFAGEGVDFSGVEVFLEGTSFQLSVWQALREIPYGEVVTYGELAAKVFVTNGARAVASACARNPLPIIIPCHRVVAAGGAIGGYSAGTGVPVKRRLLALEGVSI